MYRALVLFLTLLATPALAAEDDACVAKAATHLPPIPGIQIVKTSAQPMSPGDKFARVVALRIETRAAARDIAFAFLCGTKVDGTLTIVPLGTAN